MASNSEIKHTQARTIIAAVIEYFYLEKENMGPIKDVKKVLERVCDACGPTVSLSTVKRINAERKKALEEEDNQAGGMDCAEEAVDGNEADQGDGEIKRRRLVIRTPRKNSEKTPVRPITDLDEFDKTAIRRHILSYYERREVPTIRKLETSLTETELFKGKKSSLCKVVKSLGFVYKKFNSRKVLTEKPSVALQRCQFLRKVHSIDFEKAVFLDETWMNENISKEKGWTDGTVKGTLAAPLGKGKRLIICHAGSQQGWIEAPPLVFRSNKTSDYHEDMNADVFERWFFETLLPCIPVGSVIIMDNAPYHSRVKDKAPTSNSTKGEMTKWLKDRKITFSPDLRKPELYNVVKLHKPPRPTYIIDSKASELGYNVIRLPPYHCHYNAIEMVWGCIKTYVKEKNVTFKLQDVEKIFSEAVTKVTPDLWYKYVQHVKKSMNEDWESEGLNNYSVREFIINLCPGDTDSENDSESEFDEDDIGCAPLQ